MNDHNSQMSSKGNLPNKTTKISQRSYALLFSEVVQYCYQKSKQIDQFAKQLHSMGYPIGYSILEVINQGSQAPSKLETKTVNMLLWLKEKLWPYLFGYQASNLEQQVDDSKVYMLYDDKPSIVQYISHPTELKTSFTCCSFVAGIVEGILVSSGFPCQVTAHPNGDSACPDRVVYLIKFVEDGNS